MAGPKVQILRNFIPSQFPPPGSLLEGELAANIADGRLWIGDAAGDPQLLTAGSGSASTLLYAVQNLSGSAIPLGALVKLDYTVVPPSITLADSDDAALNMPATGITTAIINNGALGVVQILGIIPNVTGTNGVPSGTQLFTGSAGALLTVEPVFPDTLQSIGSVLFPESAPLAGDGTIWVGFITELSVLDGGLF